MYQRSRRKLTCSAKTAPDSARCVAYGLRNRDSVRFLSTAAFLRPLGGEQGAVGRKRRDRPPPQGPEPRT
jgi:hypothetical protein